MAAPSELSLGMRLQIPEALFYPDQEGIFPSITLGVLDSLRQMGWRTIGLMVAVVDEDGSVMMLPHRSTEEGKNQAGVLGGMGETSKGVGADLESPKATLFRAIIQELGVEDPKRLGLRVHSNEVYVINQWPRGDAYPGQYACAISFPAFITNKMRKLLTTNQNATDEIAPGIRFISPTTILNMPESSLRPGVKPWLEQLIGAKMLSPRPEAPLRLVNFSSVFASLLEDINL